MNAWFDDFAIRSAEIASRHGAPIDAPHLNAAIARELLELTRVVAHTGERQYAPLVAYVLGQTVERMTRLNPQLDTEEIVGFLADIKQSLAGKSSGD
jgi:hypothetical protein